MHGDGDLLSVELARATAALIPRADVKVVAGAGHMPFWERPGEFFGQVREFLGARDLGG